MCVKIQPVQLCQKNKLKIVMLMLQAVLECVLFPENTVTLFHFQPSKTFPAAATLNRRPSENHVWNFLSMCVQPRSLVLVLVFISLLSAVKTSLRLVLFYAHFPLTGFVSFDRFMKFCIKMLLEVTQTWHIMIYCRQ
jgi:hypothetical protein